MFRRTKSSADTTNGEKPFDNGSKPSSRRGLIYIAEFLTLLSIIFLILVLVGNTHNSKTLTRIYFLKIDVSNVIPTSFPNAVLVNSIAQTLGLRDFYQVGLWNYCEGYKNVGVTHCSKPKTLYYFNPVEILLSELLAGASIALPTTITDALSIAKKASQWSFACYFVGICFLFVSLLVGWTAERSRKFSIITGLISFIAALFTTIAAAISTALYSVFRSVFESQPDFNIRATLGAEMYAFVWLAAAFSLAAFVIHAAHCCTCCSCCGRAGQKRRKKAE